MAIPATKTLTGTPVGKPSFIVSKTELAQEHSFPQNTRYLIASPYTDAEHLLDLESLNTESQLLSEALQKMRAVIEDYSTRPYLDSFNWTEVVDHVRELAAARHHTFRETSWYIVAFRSQIKSTAVYPDLGALDKAAHAEAMASGGFLKLGAHQSITHTPIVNLCCAPPSKLTLDHKILVRHAQPRPAQPRDVHLALARRRQEGLRGTRAPEGGVGGAGVVC